jgi:hypothetical protein
MCDLDRDPKYHKTSSAATNRELLLISERWPLMRLGSGSNGWCREQNLPRLTLSQLVNQLLPRIWRHFARSSNLGPQ